MVGPTALVFRWFGVSEGAAGACSMAYSLGILLLAYLIARKLYGAAVGLLAAAILRSARCTSSAPRSLCRTFR